MKFSSSPSGRAKSEIDFTSEKFLKRSEYSYSCGCGDYARDNYSFIVFTAANTSNPEALNNLKTSRQIFVYKSNNGLLLQSRMYTTNSGGSYGGVNGDTQEGKLYRDLIQREISALENVPNLWITRDYYQNEFDATIRRGYGFGGYADWLEYTDCAKINWSLFKILLLALTDSVSFVVKKLTADFIVTPAKILTGISAMTARITATN